MDFGSLYRDVHYIRGSLYGESTVLNKNHVITTLNTRKKNIFQRYKRGKSKKLKESNTKRLQKNELTAGMKKSFTFSLLKSILLHWNSFFIFSVSPTLPLFVFYIINFAKLFIVVLNKIQVVPRVKGSLFNNKLLQNKYNNSIII